MASLFLSHSSQDRSVVDEVRRRLAAEGFDAVFLDYDPDQGIPAGRNWEAELYSALRRADAVLFVATESSVRSMWCFAEIALARSTGKPVFPIRMDETVTHSLLGDVQWVDVAAEGDLGYARLWTAMRNRGADPSRSFDWDPERSPYPGLAAYGTADAAVFFGRADLVSDLLGRVEARRRQQSPPFLSVVGPSGSGKSSLVRAGLVPQLRRRDDWVVVDPFRPGARPVTALARALAVALTGSPDDRVAIERRLRADSDGVAELMKDLTARDATAVLLVVDQAEELLRGEGWSDRATFMDILSSTPRKDPNVQIVCTLRSEFLGAMASDPDLAALVHDPIVVGPLPRARFPEVIEGPAQRAGVTFDPGLVGRMVEETGTGEALPLLGYALQQLYQHRRPDGRITVETLQALGGVEGALRQRADEVEEALRSAGHGKAIMPALLRLVAVDEHDEPLGRAVAVETFSEAQRQVVDAFVEARLLSTDSAGGSAVVRVAHETLFWAWPPIREAITESRQALRTQTELERLAHDWDRARRPDSYLLRGERLAAANRWLDDHSAEGSHALLRDFVDSSRERDFAALSRESALAASRVLAHLERDPEGGVLVALAAIEEYVPTPEAIGALDTAVRVSRVRGYLEGHESAVNSVTFSPDGTRVLTASDDTTARVWSVEDRRELLVLRGHSERVRSAEYSADGTRIVTASEDETIRVWDAADGSVLFERRPDPWSDPVYWATFSPDGRLIAALTASERLVLLNAADGAVLTHASAPGGGSIAVGTGRNRRFAVAFSRDGHRVATGSLYSVAHVWQVQGGRKLSHVLGLSGHAPEKAVHSVSFSPDGSHVATGSADGVALVWDLARPDQPVALDVNAGEVYFAAFSTDGGAIVAAGQDGAAVVCDATDGSMLFPLAGHHSVVLTAAFSPDDAVIATGAEDGVVRLWSTTEWGAVLPIAHDAPVYSAFFSADGSRVLTAASSAATIVDAGDGSAIQTLTGHDGPVVFASYSPDGSRIATASGGTVRVWSSSGELECVIEGHDSPVQMAAFSSDGERVITCAGGRGLGGHILGGVKVWDVSGGRGRSQEPLVLRSADVDIPSDEDESVRSAMLSADGTRIVAAVGTTTARVWDTDTSELLLTLTGHRNVVNYAEFSPDGSLIVTASDDATAQVWNAEDGTTRTVLSGHRGKLGSARFSPDGARIVTASADGTAIVWDTATGKSVSELWHGAQLIWATFSPDGRYILTVGGDGVVWMWDHVQPDELIAVAKSHVFRRLTAGERQEYGLP